MNAKKRNAYIRIRLTQLQAAIDQGDEVVINFRGNDLLQALFESGEKNSIYVKDFFAKNEKYLRSIPLLEVGGAPTIYRGLKDYCAFGKINIAKAYNVVIENRNDKNRLTGPLLATIHWLNSEPIPKNCEVLASKHGLSASYLYKAWLTVVKDPQHRRNANRLNRARQYLLKPAALRLLDKEIKEIEK